MQSFLIIIALLVALHFLLVVQALRVAERKQKWSGSKLSFAKFSAVVIPLLGPLLMLLALAPESPSDPNLPHSVDVLHERL